MTLPSLQSSSARLIAFIACLVFACSDGARPQPTERPLWMAQWIWFDGDSAPSNFYLYCRKSFTIDSKVTAAPIHVTADSRYKLFVNGTFVGRGPVRSDPRWQYYDTYDLAPFLRAGENVLSAIVHQYGVPTSSYMLGRGGFLLQGDVHQAGGSTVALDSNETWRVLPATSWQRDVPRASPGIMWVEIYDARKEPGPWQRPGYDDSDWQTPALLGTPPVSPWDSLVARDIPILEEEESFATAVLDQGVVDAAPPSFRVRWDQPAGEAYYVFAYLHSPSDQQVALAALDWQRVIVPKQLWLDGTVYSLGPRQLIEFPLKRGWNELLLKVGSGNFEVMLGPAEGQTYQPVQWYAERSETTPNRAWLGGPYAGQGFTGVYDMERAVLGRAPGTPLSPPGNRTTLALAPSSNIALVMAMETRHSQSSAGLRDADKLLQSDDGPATVSTAASGQDVYVTLDFGKEVAGFVRLRLTGVAGGIVDLGYSETLLDGHVDTLRDNEGISFADRYIMKDGPQEWELFFWKGLRYLQVTFRQCTQPVQVESASLLFTSYPVRYRGRFESSDPLLDRIWETGRWTLQLCMHDAYEDTPWREQSQWVGDAQVELLANDVTFGDVALSTKYLRQIAQGQADDGNLPSTYPGSARAYPERDPGDGRTRLSTFMAQWVSTLSDHYLYTGSKDLVSELYPSVQKQMGYFGQYRDDHGLLAGVPGFAFLDWAAFGSFENQPGEELTGLNCHYYRALLDAAELASVAGDEAQHGSWLREADTVKQAINDRLWSEDRGAYLHGRVGDQSTGQWAVQDSLLAIYAGVAPPERAQRSLTTLATAQDFVPIGSPYFYFFYLQALRRAGQQQAALDAMRDAYGKMLDQGATTWWEHLAGKASRSHGWGTGPSYDLSTYVLGVKPTQPGFTAFRVEPQPGDLTWARGVVPSVAGDIAVEWSAQATAFVLRVDVPARTEAELSVPAASLQATALQGDGPAGGGELRDGRAHYQVAGPGRFEVRSSW